MCGIAGEYNSLSNAIEMDSLRRMTDAIDHRGPDGEGQWLSADKKVGLGHRRLSIIDLSNLAKQPMQYADERYTITFNGEIYNYIELREGLKKDKYQFKSGSDTEVLLALFDRKREKCLEDLDGMFAFAIWDEKEKILFCARDRFGEKPFFYHYKQGKKFSFASEMKALWAAGVKKEINPVMMLNFLSNKYVLSNPRNKQETFYEGISKLEPAHYLILDSNLNLVKKRYWDIHLDRHDTKIKEEQAISRFKELLTEAVKLRLRSDVPVGSSLSGGLDSSTIVCLIDRINVNKKIKQKTFSARFKDFAKDEGRFMEMVIQKTRVESHFSWPDEDMFVNDFDKILYHQEEPFGGASIMAQWSVMKLAKENEVTVLLDGQGADEILAGYHYYFSTYINELYNNKSPLYQKELAEYKNLHNPSYTHFTESSSGKPSGPMALIKNAIRPIHRKVFPNRKFITENGLLSDAYLEQFQKRALFDLSFEGGLSQQLYYNTCISGLEDLLRFADRNSMAHSREVRLPFLSHKLVEFVFSLPSELKIRNGWTKYLLRKSMNEVLPEEITWRVDKIGYEPPQKKWMENPKIRDWVNEAKLALENKGVIRKGITLNSDNDWLILMASKVMA
jgi:asparagine synthase (glutamine-hydrolysing)